MAEGAGGWWVISEKNLRRMLDRARRGDDPDLLIVEEYANSETERR